jgi:histidine ammonia-lyase
MERLIRFLNNYIIFSPHQGQLETAKNIRNILKGSSLINSPGKKVQDPYSFRCIPQVHGAVKDTIRYAESVILTEINSVTDNPTIFPDEDLVFQEGTSMVNHLLLFLIFWQLHLQNWVIYLKEGVYQINIWTTRTSLNSWLQNQGLNSGFMIPQYTAASIVSQNKQLATPALLTLSPHRTNRKIMSVWVQMLLQKRLE